MIEAYEIGITLALDNGVATGIATIRRDLDALDRAVANSAAGLAALGRLSAGVAVNTPAYPPFQATALPSLPPATEANTEPPTVPSKAPVITPTPVHSPNLPVFIEPKPSAPPSDIVPATPLRPPQPPPAQNAAAAAPPALPPGPVPTIKTAADTPATLSRPRTSPTPPHPLTAARLPEPIFGDPAPINKPPSAPTPLQPATVSRLAAPPSVKMILPFPTAPLPSFTGVITKTADSRPIAASSPPPARSLEAPPDFHFAPMSTHPAAPAAPASRPRRPYRPESFPQTASPTPPDQAHRAIGAPHGELILDGARLGRWMADRLARAADRPQSGTTAFDPRISASYAGAPNGS